MRSIADQAGIEAGSIYYHFSSKEELVDVVLSHGADSIMRLIKEHMDALPPGANAERRFKAALLGLMSSVIKHGDYDLAHGRLLNQLPAGACERQIKRREQHQKIWSKLLLGLRSEGMLREDVDLSLCRVFILGSINSTQMWFNPKKGSLEEVVDQFCTIFFEGVRPVGSRKGNRKATLVSP